MGDRDTVWKLKNYQTHTFFVDLTKPAEMYIENVLQFFRIKIYDIYPNKQHLETAQIC